jgi:hypothetical protein
MIYSTVADPKFQKEGGSIEGGTLENNEKLWHFGSEILSLSNIRL